MPEIPYNPTPRTTGLTVRLPVELADAVIDAEVAAAPPLNADQIARLQALFDWEPRRTQVGAER
jgi:hypothetical protein